MCTGSQRCAGCRCARCGYTPVIRWSAAPHAAVASDPSAHRRPSGKPLPLPSRACIYKRCRDRPERRLAVAHPRKVESCAGGARVSDRRHPLCFPARLCTPAPSVWPPQGFHAAGAGGCSLQPRLVCLACIASGQAIGNGSEHVGAAVGERLSCSHQVLRLHDGCGAQFPLSYLVSLLCPVWRRTPRATSSFMRVWAVLRFRLNSLANSALVMLLWLWK